MRPATTEEFNLLCDIPGCQAALSLVAGVPRSLHGWGRLTVYGDGPYGGRNNDYDLCSEHYKQTMHMLRGKA